MKKLIFFLSLIRCFLKGEKYSLFLSNINLSKAELYFLDFEAV